MQMIEMAGLQHVSGSVGGQFLSSRNNNASLVFDLRRDEIEPPPPVSTEASHDKSEDDDDDDDGVPPRQLLKALLIGIDKPSNRLAATRAPALTTGNSSVSQPTERRSTAAGAVLCDVTVTSSRSQPGCIPSDPAEAGAESPDASPRQRQAPSLHQAECSPPTGGAVASAAGASGGAGFGAVRGVDTGDGVNEEIYTPTGDRTGADNKTELVGLPSVAAVGESTTVKSSTQTICEAKEGATLAEAKSSLPTCSGSPADSACLPHRRLHSSKTQAWRGHPGWKLRKGRGLISWIYTSPFGEDYESEQEALFIEKTIQESSTDVPVAGPTQVGNTAAADAPAVVDTLMQRKWQQETVHTAVGTIAVGDDLSVVWPGDGQSYKASVRRVSTDKGIELFYAKTKAWEDWTEWLAVSDCTPDRVKRQTSRDRDAVLEQSALSEFQSPRSSLEHTPALPAQQAPATLPGFHVGDAVEANYRQLGQFYGGMIQSVNNDGSFVVAYHDGDHENRVLAANIRSLQQRRRRQTQPAVAVTEVAEPDRKRPRPLNKRQRRKSKKGQKPAASRRPTLVLRPPASSSGSIGGGGSSSSVGASEPAQPSETVASPEAQSAPYVPPSCDLKWLPGPDTEQSVQAAIAAGYHPWCELSDRPLLDPPQDSAIANAKYVYISTKSLGKQLAASESDGLSPEERAAAAVVRASLSYPDSSGDTAVWMVMATRPIRQHEEILVEKYQQLESGVSNDGSGIRSAASQGPVQLQNAKPLRPQRSDDEDVMPARKVKRPRSTQRSAGVQQLDAAQKWTCLRPSLDRCNEYAAPKTDEDGFVSQTDSSQRFVIPPPLRVTADAATRGSEGALAANGQPQHRPWGGVLDYSAYAANSNRAIQVRDDKRWQASTITPFRKAGGDGSRLTRAEGVAAVHQACVLGKGVYISPSIVHGAGNGLFCDLPQGLERGDAITVYDGILESVGGLLYDAAQQAFFNPKLVSEHTSPDNPLWKFAANRQCFSHDGTVGGSEGTVGGSKGFQSHWKDAGAAPGGTSVIMGFGGWPVPFAPCGLGAGAMVNAVYSCKGRVGRDPEALAQRQAERARRQQLGIVEKKRPVGSKLACSLGWGNMGRKRKRSKKKVE